MSIDLKLILTNKFLEGVAELLGHNDFYGKYETVRKNIQYNLIKPVEYDIYLQNDSKDSNDSKIAMTFAVDTNNENNKELLNTLIYYLDRKVNILISGVNEKDKFICTHIKAIPYKSGVKCNKNTNAKINIVYKDYSNAEGLDEEIVEKVKSLPLIRHQKFLATKGIEQWSAYVDILEKAAQDKTIELMFNDSKILNRDLKVCLTNSDRFTEEDVKKLKKLKGANVKIAEMDEYGISSDEYYTIGSMDKFNKEKNEIIVALNAECQELCNKNELDIFDRGSIIISDIGDIAQTKRLKEGFKTLQKGSANNEFLEQILFEADALKYRKEYKNYININKSKMLIPSLNERQLEAVEGILNSKDLYLVQGPPGTGKTTVISEVCYQNALRGKKTLITSQSNLAVDNALGRLVHKPEVRALRCGNQKSLEKNSSKFLEKNIIKTWLDNTKNDCEERLKKKLEHLNQYKSVIEAREDLNEKYDKYKEHLLEYELYKADYNQKEMDYLTLSNKVEYLEKITNSDINTIEKYEKDNRLLNIFKEELSFINEKQILNEKIAQKIEDLNTYKIDIDRYNNKLKDILGKKFDESLLIKSDLEIDKAEDIINTSIEVLRKKPPKIFLFLGFSGKWRNECFDSISKLNILREKIEDNLIYLENEHNIVKKEIKELSNEANERFYINFIETLKSKKYESGRILLENNDILSKKYQNIIQKIKWIDNSFLVDDYKDKIKNGELASINNIFLRGFEEKFELLNSEVEILKEWSEKLNSTDRATLDKLKNIYVENANVVGITCSVSASRNFTKQFPNFDVVIVDEVSKATPPELLLPLLKAKKIVLIGDHKQLPPLVGSDTLNELAENLGMDDEEKKEFSSSVFENLFTTLGNNFKTMLNTQYRMHDQIMHTINQFYSDDGEEGLICGLENPDKDKNHNLSNELINSDNHVIWIDVAQHKIFEEKQPEGSTSYYNPKEIDIIINLLEKLNEDYKEKNIIKDVAVISAYKAQSKMLREKLREKSIVFDNLKITTDTVDNFQGMESKIVIVSFVSNNSKGRIGFFKDPRRVNVALSRAQELLIIIACSELFCEINKDKSKNIYKNIYKVIDKHGGIRKINQLNMNI